MCECYYKRDTFINISNVHISNVHVSLQDKWLHQLIKCSHVTTIKTPSSTNPMYTDQMYTYHYKTHGFISRSNVQMLLQERHLHQQINCAHIKCARITTRQMASSTDQMCTHHDKLMASSLDQICKGHYKRDTFINRSIVHNIYETSTYHDFIK